MKKNVFGRNFGRTSNQRKALFRGLVCSLLEKGRIETTLMKAKAVKGLTEKLITKAKTKSLADRRVIFRFLNKRSLVDHLVDGITPFLQERQSGYLRIIKLGARKGDRAPLAQLSFVDEIPVEKTEKQQVPNKGKKEKVKKEVEKETKEEKND